jgi:NADP-dependent 3-hydroxy acid dehydrogenase YdfG
MPTIAIIGAGPGLGLAIARTFGSQGFDVALISRNKGKLDALASELAAADGITAAGFPADVLDRPSLRAALAAAKERFGGIDVLEYSPADTSAGTLAPVDIRQATPENVQPQIEYYLYGAMTATEVVLPDLLAAGAGTLLFTTGGGSVYPVARYGNVTVGGAALRNWALNLGEALAGTGVHIAHIAIALHIGDTAPAPGWDFLPAADIAPLYWDLHHTRAVHELVVKK